MGKSDGLVTKSLKPHLKILTHSNNTFIYEKYHSEEDRGTPSEIRDPTGEIISSTTNYYDFAVARINLDCKLVHLDYNQSKLTALKAKYGPGVTITDPGKLASVLVASEERNVTVDQMIKEFDLELLDDYLNRAREFRLEKGLK